MVPVGQKRSVTILCVALGGFADRIKNLPETLSVDRPSASGFHPARGRLYTWEHSGQGELTGHRLALLRGELIDPAPLAPAARNAIENPLVAPIGANVFPPLDRALTRTIPNHIIDPRVCELKGRCIRRRGRCSDSSR